MKLLKLLTGICAGALAMSPLYAATMNKNVVVNTSVLDIRTRLFSEANPILPEELMSQALLNETMTATDENNGWYYVVANEQTWTVDGKLTPVQGWALANHVLEVPQFPAPNLVVTDPLAHLYSISDFIDPQPYHLLSLGTKLVGEDLKLGWWSVRMPDGTLSFVKESHVTTLANRDVLSAADVRKGVIALGTQLIDMPYVSGGRSVHSSYLIGESTGMDSGSLIDLLFRSFNITVPRTPDGQYRQAKAILTDPQKADLVFLIDPKRGVAIHTMMIVNDDVLLECTIISQCVRTMSATDLFGKPIHQLTSGDTVADGSGYQIFFGSLMDR